jgi:hypothetical protein
MANIKNEKVKRNFTISSKMPKEETQKPFKLMQTQFASLKSSQTFKISKHSQKTKQSISKNTLPRTKTKEQAKQFQNHI